MVYNRDGIRKGDEILTGVYLQGGGAKGAFQAGVLCALNDRGIRFNIIAGTSIGGINGYFVLKNAFGEMKDAWLTQNFPRESIDIKAPVIESSGALSMLNAIDRYEDCDWVKHFYVNYVPVIDKQLTHGWSDLVSLDNAERYARLRQSSLLPKGKGVNPFDDNYSLEGALDQFRVDLDQGVYDDFILDGGLLNNRFMEPFIKTKVSKLYMIVFKTNFEIPEYLLEVYDESALCVIASSIHYEKEDTLNFSPLFIKENFEHGYALGSRA